MAADDLFPGTLEDFGEDVVIVTASGRTPIRAIVADFDTAEPVVVAPVRMGIIASAPSIFVSSDDMPDYQPRIDTVEIDGVPRLLLERRRCGFGVLAISIGDAE